MKETTKGYIYGLSAAFLWGTHAVVGRFLTESIPGIVVAESRLFVASIFFLLILLATKKKIDFRIQHKKWFAITVLLGFVLNFITLHIGLAYASASNIILLENTAPVFLLFLLAVFFREKIKGHDILAVVLALIGVGLIMFPKGGISFSGTHFFGNLLGLGAAFTWAIFVLGSSRVFSAENTATERLNNLLKIFFASALLLSPAFLVYGGMVTRAEIPWLLFLGIFPTGIAYVLWFEAVHRMSTVSAVLMSNLAIVFTVINERIFLQETLTAGMVAGAVSIIAAVTVSKFKERSL